MQKTALRFQIAALVGGAIVGSAFADYDVLVHVETGGSVRYSVSADGKTWTSKGAFGADTGAISRAKTWVAPGDGSVYCARTTSIAQYDTTAAIKKVWKDGLTNKTRIYLSPDHIWFYVGDYESGHVARYRVSDPAIGGDLALNDAAHGGINGANNRDITFGRDGVMYLGCRGNNITETTADNYGENDTGRGTLAYDVTVAGCPLLNRYPAPGAKNGVAVMIDDDNDRIITYDSKFRYFDIGNTTATKEASSVSGGNVFFTFDLGDLKFFGDYNSMVHPYDLANDTWSTVNIATAKADAISDITWASVTDSKLPQISGVWYMNESSGSTVVNGANPGVMDLSTEGAAYTGVRGASRNGILIYSGGTATIGNSAGLLPATGDFTVGLWVKTGKGVAQFSNGASSLGVNADGKPFFTAGGVTVTGATSVRSAWHSLMACRAGNTVELFVDGVSVGSSTLDATTALAGSGNWTLQADSAIFDEVRVYPALLTQRDRQLLMDLVAPESEKTAFDDTELKKLGTLVVHKSPADGIVSEPSVVAVGSTLYAGVDGVAYASTDAGATWVEKGTIGLSSVSFFADGSTLYAVGLDGEGYLTLGTASSGGSSWSLAKIGNGLAVPTLKPTQPVKASGRVWLGAVSADQKQILTVSFAFASGTASDPACTQATAGCISRLTGVTAVADTNGIVRLFGSMNRAQAKFSEGFAVMQASSSAATDYTRVLTFPAASKPVAVAYDAGTKRYWMIAAAYHMKDREANVAPSDRAYALALYSSADLEDWYSHGDVTDVEVPAHFRSPSLTFSGNDLVVVAQASVNDGEMPVRLDGKVFDNVLSVKVKNFRKLWTPRIALKAYHPKEFLVCEETDQIVSRSWKEESTGDWIPSGVLCRGTDTFKDDAGNPCQPGTMISVRTFGDRVFVSSTSKDGVFEFTKTGEFRRFYPLPADPDGLCVSLDGTKIYATHWWGTKLYTIDRAANTYTIKDFTSNVLSVPRGVSDIGGGKVVISERKNRKLVIYDTVKDTYEEVTGKFGSSGQGPQDLFFEPETSRLYLSCASCGTGYYDVTTGNYTKLASTASYHGITCWDESTLIGTVYGDDKNKDFVNSPGRASAFDEAQGQELFGDVLTSGGLMNRCCVIENAEPQIGLMIVVQ